jgi:hypothetical protein
MLFDTIHDVSGATRIIGRYRLPNGQEKCVQQDVSHYASADEPHFNLLMNAVREQMTRMADKDIGDYVQEHAIVGDNMINYYTTNTTYYGGTDTTDGSFTYYQNPIQWYDVVGNDSPVSFSSSPRKIRIAYTDGKKKLVIEKEISDELEVTPEDIQNARIRWWKESRINIISRKAEDKAEDLLKSFISEIDFRNYKQKGFFTVKSGNRLFRIFKDNHKYIDMYEQKEGVFIPRNRLCVHSPTREVPLADEVVSKLMLIRSNKVIEHSNLHDIDGLRPIKKEEELLLL